MKINKNIFFAILLIFLIFFGFSSGYCQEKGTLTQSIIVNGDNVEYSTQTEEAVAWGNAVVNYGGSTLTCKKIKVNINKKEAEAEGDVRLEDEKGLLLGDKIIYNFETKSGVIVNANFCVNPYFGKSRNIERLNEKEFIARYGYFTTCNFDQPHWRIAAKKIKIVSQDRIESKDNLLYLSSFPVAYLSSFRHAFQDPLMHVRLLPGKNKDWGHYLLTAWRYNINDYLSGRIYLDYRSRLGWAEGFGTNYNTDFLGKGDLKFYYSQEYPAKSTFANANNLEKTSFQRYLIRWRHKWEIADNTTLLSELHRIADQRRKYYDSKANILKDYFYREYEKDSQPPSYVFFHHSFSSSSVDILMQKRVNHWFDQLEKLPEIKYNLAGVKLGDWPLYFEQSTILTNFNKKASMYPETLEDVDVLRLDVNNKFSLPFKLAFLEITPFVKDRQIVYDKDKYGKNLPVNTIFYSGAELTAKFYRDFDVDADFLKLNLKKIRHIVKPRITYSYNHRPTIHPSRLKYIDENDLLTSNNSVQLGLSNKLQAKRINSLEKEEIFDLIGIDVGTSYCFAPRLTYGKRYYYDYRGIKSLVIDQDNTQKQGSSFSDIFIKYKISPYSWIRLEGDTIYKHSGLKTDPDFNNYNHFSNANYDIIIDFAKERSFALGQRYERKGGNQITTSLDWKLNPKWKFSIYERYNIKSYYDASDAYIKRGFLETQFTFSRDLHCWQMDFTFNHRKNHGLGFYIVFRLKAFPEAEFSFDQTYHKPKAND